MDGIPVTLIVKAPNQQIEDQTITCELSWTIKKLKGYLSEVYPSKPSTEEQKLIYSGQLLPDTVVLKDILRQYEGQETHTVHLVCTPKKESNNRNAVNSNSVSQNRRNMQTVNEAPPVVQTDATHPTRINPDQDGLRQRHIHASTSTTSIPNTAPPAAQDPSVVINPQLTLQGTLNPQIMAQQMIWLNNAYLDYIRQYQYLIEMGISPENAYMRALQTQANYGQRLHIPQVVHINQQPINVQPVQQQQEINNPAAVPVQNPVGGVAVQDEVEGERDWLDWFYFMSRILVLFSIVYFYSSPLRFLIVLFLGLWVYLYQIGFFRNHPVEIINNNEIAENIENNNVIPQENVAQENPAPAPSNDAANANTRNTVPEPERPTLLALAWTFVSTFFASLIPETPNAI